MSWSRHLVTETLLQASTKMGMMVPLKSLLNGKTTASCSSTCSSSSTTIFLFSKYLWRPLIMSLFDLTCSSMPFSRLPRLASTDSLFSSTGTGLLRTTKYRIEAHTRTLQPSKMLPLLILMVISWNSTHPALHTLASGKLAAYCVRRAIYIFKRRGELFPLCKLLTSRDTSNVNELSNVRHFAILGYALWG